MKNGLNRIRAGAAGLIAGGAVTFACAQTIDLADQPLFSTTSAPGNLILALSVEWPTASTPAHLSTSPYDVATAYIGYFDPEKCYRYVSLVPSSDSYFTPYSLASSHTCVTTAAVPLWSGNYLNWASTHTLDAFRWVLTGGPRSRTATLDGDTTSLTILEKTNHSGQGSRGSVYPDKVITTGMAGATPFTWGSVTSRVHGLGTSLYFSNTPSLGCTYTTNGSRNTTFSCSPGVSSVSCSTSGGNPALGGTTSCTATGGSPSVTLNCSVSRPMTDTYNYSCQTSAVTGAAESCNASATYASSAAASCVSGATDYVAQSSAATTALTSTYYKVNVRVKACDASIAPGVPLEANCKQYGSNYKPEGLMQQYALKLRYSAFGYMNHSVPSGTAQRDGAVMRAKMKYIAPLEPVPGAPSVTNTLAEWDAATGVMNVNPDAADATATTTAASAAGFPVTITNSGVMNYLNKFGKVVTGNYKSNDPASELYYAAQRYYRNLGNVSEYTSLAAAGSSAVANTWLDGFPAIGNWTDPIVYSCQKNFILGIGDVFTHRDQNLPGSTMPADTLEPAVPAGVSSDISVNVKTATDMVGVLEGINGGAASLGVARTGSGGGTAATYFMAGLAYDAHTTDIRADLTGPQHISTYWLDVMENQSYRSKNQYWLAAKYGGFAVPSGFAPYAGTNGATTLPDSAWWTPGELTPPDAITPAIIDKRPDNYFLANRADKMKSGLEQAFARIISENDAATTTAFSVASAKLTTGNGASYSANYDPKTWSGLVTGSAITFAADGTPTRTVKWDARALLDAMSPDSRKIVTCCTTSGAALPFRSADLGAASLIARTDYASFGAVPGSVLTQNQDAYVRYLRGERNNEKGAAGSPAPYRARTYLLGDVSGSKANPVGPPSAPYFDLTNPGYSAFRKARATRTTVLYVGANDGMMHAFDATLPGASSCASCGTELFAYVPSFAYRGSGNNALTTGLASKGNPDLFTHHFFVDATPQNFDIDFKNTVGSTATNPDWRTLLIGGLGKGGKGYYAIDVTDPSSWTSEAAVAGNVLWEFTDPRMGYSYGDASVVKTGKYGWVVILTSGYNNSDGKGYFFIVNPRTGALIEAVETPEGSVGAPLNMAHHTAFIPDYTNFTADSVYAGDLRGNIWRVDLTGTPSLYPAPVKVAALADSFGASQPVTTRPLIEVDPNSKKRYILVGTGRLLGDSDLASTQKQSLYAIIDGTAAVGNFYTAATLPGGLAFPITRADLNANSSLTSGIGSSPSSVMGWYHDLGPSGTGVAERVNVNPIANVGVAAFGVNLPGGSACGTGGSSYILALSFGDGRSMLVDTDGSTPIASSASPAGLITDLGLLNVGGKIRLVAGDSAGTVRNVGLGPGAVVSLKRLNWREVPTVD